VAVGRLATSCRMVAMTAAQDQLIDWLPGILRTALARRLGVPAADLDALVHLERAGPLTQRDLAERLLLSSGAVTFLVDRLEQAGLVQRQPHPTDRRATLVALAPGAELP
jgi:DNA-binding MarR family transcriptional regulator